jgi:uncharacterized LabA/DUF88 family protein
MRVEPATKRAAAFVDGQNLFHAARNAFGYTWPNYDIRALAEAVCRLKGWQLIQTRFYTGVPDAADDLRWNQFWQAKLAQMGRDGVRVFSRPLRYRNERLRLPDGSEHTVLVGREKGIDVRLALDAIGVAYRGEADVLLIFSQDQDLSELADEVREIARLQNRWLKIACAFPSSPASPDRRGINGTDWIRLDRALYDACLDPRDYRPKQKPPTPAP